MPRFQLNRRAVLRGIGSIGVALPPLEIMAPRQALAATAPKRFVSIYGGFSTGTDLGNSFKSTKDEVVPAQTGPAYTPTVALQPAADLGVKSDVGIVSGLKIPWGNTAPGPAGRITQFHGSPLYNQLAGTRASRSWTPPKSASCDQLVSKIVYGPTDRPLHRSMALRVQPDGYLNYNNSGSEDGEGSIMSYGDGGKPIVPFSSPSVAFQSLFGNFTPTDNTSASKLTEQLRRKSVIDLVRGRTERLLLRLGPADRARMDQHLSTIRDLERRIQQVPAAPVMACAPKAPGSFPPVGNRNAITPGVADESKHDVKGAYSGEAIRADIMFGLIKMAFVCDLTRVASIITFMDQSVCYLADVIGHASSPHGLTHYGFGGPSVAGLAKLVGWHVRHLARLAADLGKTADVDGTSTILDNTAMVLVFEGGHGFDPAASMALTPEAATAANRTFSPHSTENMSVIVAGRAGGLKAGQHIRFSHDRHPAQVVLTAMRAVGHQGPLGEINDPIPELFR